jgi:hypothetical protein
MPTGSKFGFLSCKVQIFEKIIFPLYVFIQLEGGNETGLQLQDADESSSTDTVKKIPSEKLIVASLVKKFPAFYEIRRFITVFTTARHWSLPEPDHSTPQLPTLLP